MRTILWLSILLLGWLPSMVQAKSRLRPDQPRRLHRGIIKKVIPTFNNEQLVLTWHAPSGKVIRYNARLSAGLFARIKRYLKADQRTLAVGGVYAFTGKGKGTVKAEFAYPIKRVWRGLRVVKIDGVMPLFTATVLPHQPHQRPLVYELRGIVRSRFHKRDNKLVCLYGTWFDLKDAPHSMISQVNGIKGRSLYFFPQKYKKPRSWRAIIDPKARRQAFKAARARKRKGLPRRRRKALIPTLTKAKLARYKRRCLKRLAAWELKSASKMPPTPLPTKHANKASKGSTKTP